MLGLFLLAFMGRNPLSMSLLICYWFDDVFIIFHQAFDETSIHFASDFYSYFCLSLLFLLAVILQYTNILNVNITAIST